MKKPQKVSDNYQESQNDYITHTLLPSQYLQNFLSLSTSDSILLPVNSNNLKRVKAIFTKEENDKLKKLVNEYGDQDWKLIASFFGDRSRRQCRERWNKFLSPSVNRSPWSSEEDELLIKLYSQIGPKWTLISRSFKNRTDINIKTRYITLTRRFQKNKKINNFFQKDNFQQINSIQSNTSNKITTSLINTQIPSKDQIPLCNNYSFNLNPTETQLLQNNKILSKNDKTTKDKTHKSGFANNLKLSDWTLESLEKKVEYMWDEIIEKNIFYEFNSLSFF